MVTTGDQAVTARYRRARSAATCSRVTPSPGENVVADLDSALRELARVCKPGGPFRLSAPGVLEEDFTTAGIGVVATGEADCPFAYGRCDEFWRGTRATGPSQMAIGLAGDDAVEGAVRWAVEPLTASDGSITFDTNVFVSVVGHR